MITLSFDLVNSKVEDVKVFAPSIYKYYPCLYVKYEEIFFGSLKWSIVFEDFEIYSSHGNWHRKEVQEVRLVMME